MQTPPPFVTAAPIQRDGALNGVLLHEIQTTSMRFDNKHADSSNVFYASVVLEKAARRKFSGVELTIWIYDEQHSQDLVVNPIETDYTGIVEATTVELPDSAPSTPLHSPLALAAADTDNFDKPLCPLLLQLYVTDGSDIVSPCSLELRQANLPTPSRVLFRKQVYLDDQTSLYGTILLGYFMLSRPLYRVFSDSRSPGPDIPDGPTPSLYINHLATRVLCADPQRPELPQLAPELVERIFSNAIQRTCDWPGCRIHASMNLWLLAQVNTQWHAVAKRLHRSRESVAKKLLESCNMFEWHERPPVPHQLAGMMTDDRHFFSLSTIFEGKEARQYQGIDLSICVYGSEVPLPDITVHYLGENPDGEPIGSEEIVQDLDVLCYPVNLRFDTWGPSEEITAYQISGESTWSSRVVFTRRIMLPKTSTPFHLGWFNSSKPLCLDRDVSLMPYHFGARISVPNPKRKAAKSLPPNVLERIFELAWSSLDDAMFGFPSLTYSATPSWSWTQDLKRFAGVAKSWADVAAKLYRHEMLLSEISGYTHASCYSFTDSVPSPNHIFAVTAIFDGDSASRFDGASLTVCVPEEGVWSDVTVSYAGDTYANGQITSNAGPSSERRLIRSSDKLCDVDSPLCPLSLCLCTSADDGDSYHVAVKEFPMTRTLSTRTMYFSPASKSSKCIFFGYFHSSRAFTGSATSAIPVHVVRISLPDPKRKRFRKLPTEVIDKIAVGVTQLSDSTRRTDAWQDNLRMMSLVSRQFYKSATKRSTELECAIAKESEALVTDEHPISELSSFEAALAANASSSSLSRCNTS